MPITISSEHHWKNKTLTLVSTSLRFGVVEPLQKFRCLWIGQIGAFVGLAAFVIIKLTCVFLLSLTHAQTPTHPHAHSLSQAHTHAQTHTHLHVLSFLLLCDKLSSYNGLMIKDLNSLLLKIINSSEKCSQVSKHHLWSWSITLEKLKDFYYKSTPRPQTSLRVATPRAIVFAFLGQKLNFAFVPLFNVQLFCTYLYFSSSSHGLPDR